MAVEHNTGGRKRPGLQWRSVVTIGFVLVLLSPLIGSRDGFPLSTYPMYAEPRSPETSFVVAVGVAGNGDPVSLATSTVAGTRDPLIAETFLRDAMERGGLDVACRSIAGRAAAQDDIVQIEIRSHRHDLGDRPTERVDDRLLVVCDVP